MPGRSLELRKRPAKRVRAGSRLLVRAMATSLAFAVLAGSADAATRTWTGAANGLWSDPGNWGGTAPVAGDDLVFPVGALNATNTNDLPAGTLFNSLTFQGCCAPYVVTGSAILLGPGGLTTPGGMTLGLEVTLAADQTWLTVDSFAFKPLVTGAIHLGGRTLTLQTHNALTLSGPIDGSGALIKDAPRGLTLSGANSYAGPVTVRDGVLYVQSATALGVADGTAANGTHVEASAGVGASLAFQGLAVGNEALILEGAGETLSGALLVGGPASLAGPVTLVTPRSITNTILIASALTLSGAVGGPGELSVRGNGTLTLANGANTFAGGVRLLPLAVGQMTLALGADQAIPGTSVIDLATRTALLLDGHAQTIAAVTGTGTLDMSTAPGVLTLNGAGNASFGGSVTGTGAIVHSGTGRQAFTGISTFSGPLSVDHGVVAVSGGTVPAPITVNNDGRLSLSASGTVGAVTVSSGRLQLLEGGAATGNSGTLILAAGAMLDLGGAAPASLGQLRVAGTVTLGGAALALQPAAGFAPAGGTMFTIVANDGADAVNGTFAGLAEGASVIVNGRVFHISYVGGTGNDIVLTAATPALRTWTGAVSGLWSNPGNWGGTAPVEGDDLVFPVGALNTTNVNDLPAGTLFNSLSLSSSVFTSYSVSGNTILLGPGGLRIGGLVTFGVPTTLAADQTWTTTASFAEVTGAIHLGGRTLAFSLPSSLLVSGPIDGSGALVDNGPESLTLRGANSYAGPTTVRDGILIVDNVTALGVADGFAANGTHVLDAGLGHRGATLHLTGVNVGNEAIILEGTGETEAGALRTCCNPPSALAGPVTLVAGATIGVAAPLTLFGVVSGPGPLAFGGTSVLTLANGNNSFGGGVQMRARILRPNATLVVAADQAIPGAPTIDLPAGNTLVLNAHSQTLAALAGTGRVDMSSASGLLTLSGAGDATFAGAVTGTGAIMHTGTGRQAFTGTSTFSGPLSVDHGVVAVSGGTVPAPITVNNDGRLSLAASGTVGAVTVSSGRLQLGEGGAAIGNTGTVTLGAAATLDIGGGAPAALGQLRVTGTVTLGGATLALQLPAGITPAVGTTITIVDNDGTDAVNGTFAGLAEGATVRANGVPFHISYSGGTGNDIVLTALPPLDYLLSEGATGTFFTTDLLLANPNAQATTVRITFSRSDGSTLALDEPLPAHSHQSVRVNDLSGMQATEFSTTVRSLDGLPLAVERTMSWDRQGYGGHTERASEGAALQWYFAEGSQGFFHTYLLLANPQLTANSATVLYLREFEPPLTRTYVLSPTSRLTVDAGADPELVGRSFGMTVTFDQPGAAERAMYFGDAPLFDGGHESAGVTAPSPTWFLAEGATGSFFETFVLLANPNGTDATATVTYLPDSGPPVTAVKTIPAHARVTVNVEEEAPSLADAAVSMTVVATQPILVERSQYWPDPASRWHEAHNSFGVVATATRWAFAEGRVGGATNAQTYVLLANPATVVANVTITFLRDNGAATITRTFAVPPASRYSLPVGPGTSVPELANERFGALITADQPIAVERALYWDAAGQIWAAGTNAAATRLP